MNAQGRHVSSATLNNSFNRRSVVIGALQGGVGMLLAVRMGWIAIFQNEKYKLDSESNRVNLTLVPPRRGWILDRNGAPLASNKTDFRVDVIPDRLIDPEGAINLLGHLLGLGEVEVQDLKDKIDKAHGFQPVEAASGLDWDRFAAVSVRLPDLPGVIAQRGFSRFYPDRSRRRSSRRLCRPGFDRRLREGTKSASRHTWLQGRKGWPRKTFRKGIARRTWRTAGGGDRRRQDRARPRIRAKTCLESRSG